MSASLHLLVCQYYLREAQAVLQGPGYEAVTIGAYPDLCVHPLADQMSVVERLFDEARKEDRIVVLVGACFLLRSKVGPLTGSASRRIHHEDLCFSMLCGRRLVEHYLRSGAYLVTPGWLELWPQHIEEWRFDRNTARAFFAETTSRLVLLDTGVDPEAGSRLAACADFLNLPHETLPVGLDHFRLVLDGIIKEWRADIARQETLAAASAANRRLADYMLALDLLARLTKIMTEDEAIRVILDLFTMLFGGSHVCYATVTDGQAGAVYSTHPDPQDAARMQQWLGRMNAGDEYTKDGGSFCVRIRYQGATLGILTTDAVAFPQHADDYVNLALAIVDLCGLAIANARTISLRERAEEEVRLKSVELARSNAELEQFAYVVSHDLQAPLRRIKGFGDMLAEDAGPGLGETAREHLARIQKATARMQSLIEGLLAFSRVSTRGRPFVAVRLSGTVQQALDDLAPRIEESAGRVDVGDLPTVMADELQMYQLFQNLIGNALKFVAKGNAPHVRVFSRMIEGGMTEISVQDNGIGFNESNLEKIFVPFQRLHSEEEYPGSGIGLAVCRKIVQRHGGTITAHSRPGEGATFVVTLPVPAVDDRMAAR